MQPNDNYEESLRRYAEGDFKAANELHELFNDEQPRSPTWAVVIAIVVALCLVAVVAAYVFLPQPASAASKIDHARVSKSLDNEHVNKTRSSKHVVCFSDPTIEVNTKADLDNVCLVAEVAPVPATPSPELQAQREATPPTHNLLCFPEPTHVICAHGANGKFCMPVSPTE